MESLENIVEYYDELYPVSDGQKSFFGTLLRHYEAPARLLRINCASGAFEHALARDGYDVTGTDASRDFIDTAVRRKRIPNADVRFFQMTPSEIGRFLAKSFYQCLYMLEDALYFIGDKILFRKFFFDCRKLLAPGGSLVLHMPGFPQVRESIRVKLLSVLKRTMTARFCFRSTWSAKAKSLSLCAPMCRCICRPRTKRNVSQKRRALIRSIFIRIGRASAAVPIRPPCGCLSKSSPCRFAGFESVG